MPTFNTTTAYGRLRILWDATADPQLVMGEQEVADVETVLQEHAAMAAELKLARFERDEFHRQSGLLRGELKQAHALIDELEQAAPAMAARGECEGCGCCSQAGCHRFADATCPTDSLGDSVCPCTED